MTVIFSSLTFEFVYFFYCRLLSLQHNTLVLCYKCSLEDLLGAKDDRNGWRERERERERVREIHAVGVMKMIHK